MISLFVLIPAIIAVLALVILFSVLYVKHRNKLNKELQEKLSYFQEQIKAFFEEYFELQKQYISEELESAIISKWESFYLEVKKFHIPKKNDSADIGHFKKTYSNLHKEISDINAEFKEKKKSKNSLTRYQNSLMPFLNLQNSMYHIKHQKLLFPIIMNYLLK